MCVFAKLLFREEFVFYRRTSASGLARNAVTARRKKPTDPGGPVGKGIKSFKMYLTRWRLVPETGCTTGHVADHRANKEK